MISLPKHDGAISWLNFAGNFESSTGLILLHIFFFLIGILGKCEHIRASVWRKKSVLSFSLKLFYYMGREAEGGYLRRSRNIYRLLKTVVII